MRSLIRRHLGKLVAGSAIAVTSTAVMIGVTLPSDAVGDPSRGRGGSSDTTSAQGRQGAQGEEAGADRAQRPRPGTVEEAPPQGETGVGRDGLTDDELKRAEQLALNRGFRSASEDVEGDTGPERLSTNLAELEPSEVDDANPPRRADITYYDYKDDTYVTKTVNLTSGKVEATDTQHGVQPPPGREEVAEAVRLVLKSPLGDGLKKDYRDATGKSLAGPEQLRVTGFVYRVDEENSGAADVQDCGRHRCVRLFTKVKGGPWIDTRSLVIDLSARKVSRLS
ncbi:Tat pathway signal sequence domain protein [Streptomyces sp. H27-D2]|uniref:Tat pathway signal sequence domain protein n=1 Tax=Streptomyces sp. H27-D2 TaxID=3046304 RepID=UPI002DBDE0D6|nr:Tat pathway signal sequence domain protein [Streptomyces sp. H27-D2]MEC4019212.1 Tat pathway signal sequence domain protein [Streptomyces sp. H27-D2]